MKVSVCPTVTAATAKTYQRQLQLAASLSQHIHIDVADGILTPNKLIAPSRIWWPENIQADIHVMHQRPMEHMQTLIALQPRLIILHAEAKGDFGLFAQTAHDHGIGIGVALLQTTPVSAIKPALPLIDHVLIFSGSLGRFGGKANTALLSKVKTLRTLKPELEIGWDGGINDTNAAILSQSGIDVLNIGGYIHKAKDPWAAYDKLNNTLWQDRPATQEG